MVSDLSTTVNLLGGPSNGDVFPIFLKWLQLDMEMLPEKIYKSRQE